MCVNNADTLSDSIGKPMPTNFDEFLCKKKKIKNLPFSQLCCRRTLHKGSHLFHAAFNDSKIKMVVF
uniref:Uncharacterized protein n=1 Tax=Octopus bimaculoides TaxID=37653 RepID=A0A0L8GWM1_OCTBM